MILLLLKLAQQIPGIHLSPQHHADSQGKPEGRVIGDLTGQHDEHDTPLNGSLHDKDDLREAIRQRWGDIKHPTVDELVKMVLTSADIYGWDNILLWKKDLKCAFNLLNYNPEYCKYFSFPLILGGIVRLDRYAPCFPSLDKNIRSTMSSHHQWLMLLVR